MFCSCFLSYMKFGPLPVRRRSCKDMTMTILSALDGHNFEVAQKKVSDLCHVATNVSNPDEIWWNHTRNRGEVLWDLSSTRVLRAYSLRSLVAAPFGAGPRTPRYWSCPKWHYLVSGRRKCGGSLETSRIWSCELGDFQWFWHDRSEMFQINMSSSDCCCISVGIYPCQELQKWNYKHIPWKCEVEEILACTALARRRGDFQVMVFLPWIKQKASSKVSYVSWTKILVSCVQLGQGRMLSAKPRSQFAVLLLAPLSDRCVWFSIFLQLRGWNCRDQKCKRGSCSHSLFGGSSWNFLRSWHHSLIRYMILSFYL